MMDQTTFLPFHAINEFMRPDFRLLVIREVMNSLSALPEDLLTNIRKITKRVVSVPGFRNSEKAPAVIKILPTAKAFEKDPELVKAILSAWVWLQGDLLSQVYTVLQTRHWLMLDPDVDYSLGTLSIDIINNWPVLPPDFDRSHMPGFFPRWPEGEDFEALYTTYVELFPDNNTSIDQMSLMAVWLTLRLPYTLEEPGQ